MQPVLTADAMREADRLTIERFGIPGFTLMETAARGAFQAVMRRLGPPEHLRIAIFCGKGNNGGDGLALARMLYAAGATANVLLVYDDAELSDDAGRNLDLIRKLKAQDENGRLAIDRFKSPETLRKLPRPDLYVDALLGAGLSSALREPISSIVAWLNERPQPILAVDLPTGLHSDTGEVMGDAIRAAFTVTMGARKSGLLLGDGPPNAGSVEVVDIGIPRFVLKKAAGPGCAEVPADDDVQAWLPTRARDAHKYSAGLALVVGGAGGMTGAPVMASTAAARVRAGAVVCGCPQEVQATLAAKVTEVMTLALPSGPEGVDADGALEALAPRLDRTQALLVGPGLGVGQGTQDFIRTLLGSTESPAVIDADGLNALSSEWLSDHAASNHAQSSHETRPWILTPHVGEFKRLAGEEVDLADRIRTAQTYAQRWKCVLLLKGMPSIVACPDGRAYIITTGGKALATAGTGDILAGLCTGLLAQGLPPERAAVCAAHLGGAAADRYTQNRHPHSLQAMDLLDELPLVLKERFSGPSP